MTAPPDVAALLGQAFSAHRSDDRDSAERLYRQVIEIDANQAHALHYLGLIVHQRGGVGEAINLLRRAVIANPDDAPGWNNLGNMLKEGDQLREAIEAYREAVQLVPNHVNALNNLALVLLDVGDAAGSVASFRQAIQYESEDAELWNGLGGALTLDQQLDEAMEAFLNAVRLDPDYPEAHNNLGLAYMDQGDVEHATIHYRTALTLLPNMPEALLNLARSKHYTADDSDEIAVMNRALKREDLSEPGQTALHFALGKVHDDCGDYDRAFEHYRLGNETKNRKFRFDAARHADMVTRTIAAFSTDAFQRFQDFGSNSERPIFLVGMPRSGSSLAEQIIASHPEVKGAGELGLIAHICLGLPNELGSASEYPECIVELGPESIGRLAAGYLSELTCAGGDAEHITDKALGNFLHLGLIALLFPRAKVIHCRRDARCRLDVALSNYFQLFSVGQFFSYRLDDIATYYRDYVRIMDHWRETLPLEIHDVVYEELVKDPEGVTRALIEYCGCRWDEACLSFHRTSRMVHTASNWEVRQPIYQRSAGRWRYYEKHLPDSIRSLS